MHSFYLILDNRVSSCRNHDQVPVKYKNNNSNNSSNLTEKWAVLGPMSPPFWRCFCRGQRLTGLGSYRWGSCSQWKLIQWLLRTLLTSEFFSSMTYLGTDGDLRTWWQDVHRAPIIQRIGEQLFSISTIDRPEGNGLWLSLWKCQRRGNTNTQSDTVE